MATHAHKAMEGSSYPKARYPAQEAAPAYRQPCKALWLAVILQALLDYKHRRVIRYERDSKGQITKVIGRLQKGYFFSEDFKKICELADVNPTHVRTANMIF